MSGILWRKHPVLPHHQQARSNGCSVVIGPYVCGVEVMDRQGDIHRFNTVSDALFFVNDQGQGNAFIPSETGSHT